MSMLMMMNQQLGNAQGLDLNNNMVSPLQQDLNPNENIIPNNNINFKSILYNIEQNMQQHQNPEFNIDQIEIKEQYKNQNEDCNQNLITDNHKEYTSQNLEDEEWEESRSQTYSHYSKELTESPYIVKYDKSNKEGVEEENLNPSVLRKTPEPTFKENTPKSIVLKNHQFSKNEEDDVQNDGEVTAGMGVLNKLNQISNRIIEVGKGEKNRKDENQDNYKNEIEGIIENREDDQKTLDTKIIRMKMELKKLEKKKRDSQK